MHRQATRGIQFREPPIFERGAPGRSGASLPPLDVPAVDAAAPLRRARAQTAPPALPEVSEPEAFRHFVRLSQWNFCIDSQLLSARVVHDEVQPEDQRVGGAPARLRAAAPAARPTSSRRARSRSCVASSDASPRSRGMDAVSLQPAAGAQGELTGLMMIRAYHESKGASPQQGASSPTRAHGTNPASCALNGLDAVPFPSGADGVVDPARSRAARSKPQATTSPAIMITNPNTLGLYESAMPGSRRWSTRGRPRLRRRRQHERRPRRRAPRRRRRRRHASTCTRRSPRRTAAAAPAPARSPQASTSRRSCPRPIVVKDGDGYRARLRPPAERSAGCAASTGNFGMIVRAYTYIRELGGRGPDAVSDMAVLNANYLAALLKRPLPARLRQDLHARGVFTDSELEKRDRRQDARRRQAAHRLRLSPADRVLPARRARARMMIEPTETESKETLDAFADGDDPDQARGRRTSRSS